jgi:hypothetical protein
MRLHYIGVLVAFYASIANASPVDRNNVEMLDGDTIRIAGETFRLVGFDAPETYQARFPRVCVRPHIVSCTGAVVRKPMKCSAKTWPDAANTGYLTRLMPALDIDILNEAAGGAAAWPLAARAQRGLDAIGLTPLED